MNCLKCFETLVTSCNLCFFKKADKDVHLSIKPELYQLIKLENKLFELKDNRKQRIVCRKCNSNLGCVIPFGPDGTKFSAFSVDKVKLCHRNLTKKEKWWNTYKSFELEIEQRDSNNFFGKLKESFVAETFKHKAPTKTVFPSINNLSLFEWFSVSLKKEPRKYQIQAFVEALQSNLIVVLKTGFGKTLIASMLIGRMCEINPQKMGLMIVDRIPLVFQHAASISSDTNLRVVGLCGENKTKHTIKRINDRDFDVLIITAGAFYDMIKQKYIDANIFCVVVVDECHHATGGHKYLDVIQFFTNMPLANQPRILGLTASPINAKTISQAADSLQKFLLNFPSAKIYCPAPSKSEQNIKTQEFEYSENQSRFLNQVVNMFNKHLRNNIYSPLKISGNELNNNLLNSYQIIGELRTLESNYLTNPQIALELKLAYIYIESLEMCAVMGVRTAYEVIKDYVKEIGIAYKNVNEDSARLIKLSAILGGLEKTSKVLIFVHTRNVARALYKFLCENFDIFKPRMVFGHGGYDGMAWEGEQELAIRDFASGECNLIVATSVLEEGLDVAECDVVVSFTSIRNLIQFIQMRGRARKAGSKFYSFQSTSESKLTADIMKQEEILNHVLRDHSMSSCLFSSLSKDIIQKVQQQFINGSSGTNNSFDNKDKGSFSFLIYVEARKNISLAKERIFEVLQECNEFKVKNLEVLDTPATIKSFTQRVFTKECLVFLVGAQTHTHVSTSFETYLQFCRTFNFNIKIDDTCFWPSWTQFSIKPCNLKTTNNIKLDKVGIGYFVNKTSCVIVKEVAASSCVFSENLLTITYFENHNTDNVSDCKKGFIDVSLTSLGYFGLLSIDQHFFSLNLVLLNPPLVRSNTLGNEKKRNLDSDLSEMFSKFSLFQITCPITVVQEVQQALLSPKLFPIPHFYVKLNCVQPNNYSKKKIFKQLSEPIEWYLGCIKDSRMLCLPTELLDGIKNHVNSQINSEFQRSEVLQLCEAAIKAVFSRLNKYSYFDNFLTIYENEFNHILKIPISKRDILQDVIPSNCTLIKRVVATPTRIVMLPPVPVATNRMIRLLHSYSILIVSFRDEDMSKLHDTHDYIFLLMKNGIIVNKTKYVFFATSASQLRDHKAYFIQMPCNNEVKNLRSQIVPSPEKFNSAAKYMSRLGLYATADMGKLFELSPDMFTWVSDLKAKNGELTTDGCGKISLTMSAHIANILKINQPSALQIRFSGVKGILVCTNDDDPDLNNKPFAFRPSMKKFENNDKSFCVTSYSKYNSLILNREVITLFNAVDSKHFSEVLLELQHHELEKVSDIFNNENSARKALSEYFPKEKIDRLSIVNFHHDKFWFSVLQGIYRLKVRDLLKRASIPVKKGCLLVGVADPIGILKEGEIFLQIDHDNKKEIIIGDALVYRNPCLHPGDQRVVCCVDKPLLHYLVNVVVFSVINCQASLAASCSGGDLDGDQFAVIWDSNLIPPRHLVYPRFDYAQLTLVDPFINVDVTDENVIVDFFMKFIKNDSLGRIAHKHLALCDFIENGARNLLAVELAKSQAAAVDYPKTGILPEVPEEAILLVKKKGFPDFMEKNDCYSSNSILGYLYRKCKSIGFNFDLASKVNIEKAFGSSLCVPGYREYLEDALEVYACYVHNIKAIMSWFDLKVEADVVLGCATYSWSTHFEADKGKASKSIAECYKHLVKRFRAIFFSNIDDDVSKMKKACAWYNLVYDNTIKIFGHKKKFSGFPWVISDVLCEVFQERNNHRPSDFFLDIGSSALNYFSKSSSLLLKSITDKTKVLNIIDHAIQRFVKKEYRIDKSFKVSTYGSTSIYVCEPESDVDICIFAEQNVFSSDIFPVQMRVRMAEFLSVEREKHILQFVISRALDSVVSSKREILEAKIPIIKCVVGDEDSAVNCDISMNLIGRLKTQYIHFLYRSNCLYLPLFWILVSWARVVGLVKSALNCNGVMDTAEFYSVIIGLMDTKKFEKIFVDNNRYSSISYLYSCLDKLKKSEKHELGLMLHTFFRKATNLKGNLVFCWPAPNIPDVSIDNKVTEKISIFAQNAYHSLSATKNLNDLFLHVMMSQQSTVEYSIKLPLSVSYAMQAYSFHSTRLSKLTGAVVTITPKEGTKNLVITAVGSSLSINLLRSEIRDLIHTNKTLSLGVLPKKRSKYFMEGSSFLIVEGKTLTNNPTLKFEESLGAFELLHACNRKDSLYLETDLKTLPSWLDEEYIRFQSCISMQMSKFPCGKNISLEATSRFGCFYLIDLTKRLPDSTTCLKMSEIERSIERGRFNRKKWSRTDYTSSSIQQQDLTNKMRFKMVRLAPAKTSFAQVANKIKRKKKSMYTGISTAFTPGLLQSNTSDESARQKLLRVYEEVLLECGFQNRSIQLFTPWKVALSPSTSFEVDMRLSESLDVIQIAERPLNWIHATFISSKKQTFIDQVQTNPDIRFLISSQDPIKTDSELYNAVYPLIKGVRTLPISLVDGKPKLSLFGGRSFVSSVRHIELRKEMSNGSVDANISYGQSFFGYELQLMRPFCELSLQFNTEKLKNSLGEFMNIDLLNEFTKDFYYKSVEVRNILEKCLSQNDF